MTMHRAVKKLVFYSPVFYLQSSSASFLICSLEMPLRAERTVTVVSAKVRFLLSASIF